MTTQAVTRQKRVRYRSKSSTTRIFFPSLSAFLCLLGLLITVPSIGALGHGQGAAGPVGIAAGAFLVLSALGFIAPVFWPVLVLTTHTLRRPRVLRRAQIIPLDEITGVGLVYLRPVGSVTPNGWFLYLWTTGDIPRDVGIAYHPASWLFPADQVREKFLAVEPSAAERGRPFNRYRFSNRFDPVSQTDPGKVAATYAGRVAREIYDRVLAYQGPSGPLAVQRDQKHVGLYFGPVVWVPQTAYWSPDGEIGHTTAQPQLYGMTLRRGVALRSGAPPLPDRVGPMLRLRYRLARVARKFRRRGSGHPAST